MEKMESKEITMLQTSELDRVCGGIALGTGPRGIFSPTNIAGAGRLVGGLGYLGGAFSFGYAIGSYGYSAYTRYRYNTP